MLHTNRTPSVGLTSLATSIASQEAGDVWPAATGLPLSARLATGKSRPEWAKLPLDCT